MLFVRGSVQLVAIVPILCWTRVNIFGPPDIKTRIKLVAVASIGGFMLLCVFEGIGRLPLGDYSAIAFSSPAFTMVLSIFLLKEHCGIYRSLIGIILTAGVVIISRPSALFPIDTTTVVHIANSSSRSTPLPQLEVKTSSDIIGIVFALTGSLLSAWVTILIR